MSRHPNVRGRPTNGNHLDREVLQGFLSRPVEMRVLAKSIREALLGWEEDAREIAEPDVDDLGVEEG